MPSLGIMTADELRTALAANQTAIDALEADDFAGRFRLKRSGDELRTALHDLVEDELDEASKAWAERAGRKGEHEQPDADVYRGTMPGASPGAGI